jgi:uncharacterized membrane protein
MKTTKLIRGLLLIFSLAFLPACNELVQNSNSYDDQRYSSDFQGTPEFLAIAPVLAAKCMNCHYHAEWYEYSETEFKSSAVGLVVFQNPDASPIYNRLSNSPSSLGGPKNMPQGGGAAFTDAEVALLAAWINL